MLLSSLSRNFYLGDHWRVPPAAELFIPLLDEEGWLRGKENVAEGNLSPRTRGGRSQVAPFESDHPVRAASVGFTVTSELVDNFTRFSAPSKTVRFPAEANHAEAMVCRITSRISCDRDHIARPQGFSRHTLAAELARATPFDSPSLHGTGLVGCLDVHERMGVAE